MDKRVINLWNNIETRDKPYYQNSNTLIYHADSGEILSGIKGVASAIVTDPPYELGFMGKDWDSKGVSFRPETWRIIREVCKPGAMLLSFGGSRTFHRIACAIEDAGWIIKDTIMWVYGSGFPKSLDIGKAVDKKLGNERDIIGISPNDRPKSQVSSGKSFDRALDKGQGHKTLEIDRGTSEWEGYGTGLKPAYEPICLAMNPLDGTFAENCLKWGVGGLNVDECRVEYQRIEPNLRRNQGNWVNSDVRLWDNELGERPNPNSHGRFPANFIHDGSQEVMELFPESKSTGGQASLGAFRNGDIYGKGLDIREKRNPGLGDSGSAARFFYCAKASRAERDAGLEDMPELIKVWNGQSDKSSADIKDVESRWTTKLKNTHPTVKPLTLMEYLVKLVEMPEYNLIIDPFCGSGTTLLACQKLGIPCIGIDNDEKSCEIAAKRCNSQNML